MIFTINPLQDPLHEYLSALALLTIRAGGEIIIEHFSELDHTSGDLTLVYNREHDRLTVTHRMRPSPAKAKWN